MLGVRRASVTEVLRPLQNDGLIRAAAARWSSSTQTAGRRFVRMLWRHSRRIPAIAGLNRSPPSPRRASVAVERFEASDEQQIDNLKCALVSDNNRAAGLVNRHDLWMCNVERAAIGQVNSELLKGCAW